MTPPLSTLAVFVAYPLVFVAAGVLFRRRSLPQDHLLHAHRSLSLPMVSLAFLASNCSALEIVGMIALAAKYGMIAIHFYWIGAIPALAFLLLVLLPRYQALRLRSIPEFLGERFSPSTQVLSALSFTCLMVVVAGITLGLESRILHLALGLNLAAGVCFGAVLVAMFLVAGGLRAVIYAQAPQLLLFLLVLAPLAVLTLRHNDGIAGTLAALPLLQRHPLRGLPAVAPHAPMDLLAVVLGLGFCLSFTYWCADFSLVQRLCAARDEEMLQTPRFALVAKLVMPLVLILPGLGLARLSGFNSAATWDLALPVLLQTRYAAPLASIALATLCASCFLSVCANLAAAAAVYATSVTGTIRLLSLPVRLRTSDRTLLVALSLLSALAGLVSFHSRAVMETLQLTLSMLNVPVACVFLAGVFAPRISRRAGTPAMLAGTAAAFLHWQASAALRYGSTLIQAFYGAIVAAVATFATLCVLSAVPCAPVPLAGRPAGDAVRRTTVAVAAAALATMVLLYVAFA